MRASDAGDLAVWAIAGFITGAALVGVGSAWIAYSVTEKAVQALRELI